ncbi:MalQ-D enzyme [Pelomyxa schiedti]|nr:MalQ-D enzyme [Pelomyxa schiedti]
MSSSGFAADESLVWGQGAADRVAEAGGPGIEPGAGHEVVFDAWSKWESERIGRGEGDSALGSKIKAFEDDNLYWLPNYCEFCANSDTTGDEPWWKWNDQWPVHDANWIRRRDFHKFMQFMFYDQWRQVVDYAHAAGVAIIGDTALYVALNTADVWKYTKYFQVEPRSNGEAPYLRAVSGAPPDQCWGHPLYNWGELEADNFQWWMERIKTTLKFVDATRLDHFIGFHKYWAVNSATNNPMDGCWLPGPGMRFFEALKKTLGSSLPCLPEDLGEVDNDTKALLKIFGLPSMRVFQYGFDPSSCGLSEHLPSNCGWNTTYFSGSHDSNTLLGWLLTCSNEEKANIAQFLGLQKLPEDKDGLICLSWQIIAAILHGPAFLTLVQVQDVLGLCTCSRINDPYHPSDGWKTTCKCDKDSGAEIDRRNWEWHLDLPSLTDEVAKRLNCIRTWSGRW